MALSFMSLPPELRNEVYKNIFNESYEIQLTHYYPEGYQANYSRKSMVTRSRARNKAELRNYTSLYTRQPPPFYAGILQTCWQIYRETCHLLYAKTVFHFFFLPNPNLASLSKMKTYLFPKQSLQHRGPRDHARPTGSRPLRHDRGGDFRLS